MLLSLMEKSFILFTFQGYGIVHTLANTSTENEKIHVM